MFFKINLSKKVHFDECATFVLVPLMIISAILSETVFKSLQVSIELLLLFSFLMLIIRKKLDRQDIFVLVIYFIANLFSVFYLNITAFMLNIKQFGLPILALIYFRKRTYNSVFLHFAFIFCVILLIVQKIIGYYPLPVNQFMTTLKDEMEGRPLGLFLNYHFSAFFVAVYLLGFTFKKTFYLIDYLIIFLYGVMTSLFSYLGQKLYSFYFGNRNKQNLRKQLILFLLSLTSFLFLLRFLLDSLDIPEGAISGLVIFYQLTDVQTYIRVLNLLPRDIYEFYKHSLYDYSGTRVDGFSASGNEISFIQILVQGGLILGLTFLNFILKNITFYRVFIFLSLIHYSYLFSPLIIYTMCYFENRNKIIYE